MTMTRLPMTRGYLDYLMKREMQSRTPPSVNPFLRRKYQGGPIQSVNSPEAQLRRDLASGRQRSRFEVFLQPAQHTKKSQTPQFFDSNNAAQPFQSAGFQNTRTFAPLQQGNRRSPGSFMSFAFGRRRR